MYFADPENGSKTINDPNCDFREPFEPATTPLMWILVALTKAHTEALAEHF